MANPVEYKIYKITSPSGRIYIGQTKNPIRRFEKYKSKSLREVECQPMLRNSFLKYGYLNHTTEIIDTHIGDRSGANDKEMFWIRTYMCNYLKYPEMNGLNLTNGGLVGNGCEKKSEETRRKISESLKGRKVSEFVKQRAAEVHKGHKYNAGRVHSPESIRKRIETMRANGHKRRTFNLSEDTKQKMRKSAWVGPRTPDQILKIKNGAIEKRGRRILQYDLFGNFIKEYKSIGEAAIGAGVSKSCVERQASGVNGKPKIYIFKYK